MTTDRVRKRIQTNSSNVADGLEKLQEDLFDLFNAHLDKFRDEMLARDEERLAMLKSLVHDMSALQAGIVGLSQQLSIYEARAVGDMGDAERR